MNQCGRTTRRGTACAIPLRGGKCQTHDCDLRARNRAVAQSFKKHHFEAFMLQRSAAGRRGFWARVATHGMADMLEAVRQFRLRQPSGPEKWMMGLLKRNNINGYERELIVDEQGHTLDLGWRERRVGILMNGHQHKASFGEMEPRAAKQAQLVKRLRVEGWTIVVVDWRTTRREQWKLGEWVIGKLREAGIEPHKAEEAK